MCKGLEERQCGAIEKKLVGADSKSIVFRSAASQNLWPWKLCLLGVSSPKSETGPLTTRPTDHVLKELTEMKCTCLSPHTKHQKQNDLP